MHWAAEMGRMCWTTHGAVSRVMQTFSPARSSWLSSGKAAVTAAEGWLSFAAEEIIVFWEMISSADCGREGGTSRSGKQEGRAQALSSELGAASIRSAMEMHWRIWRIWKEPGWMVSKPCWFVFRKWKSEQKKLLLGNDICKSAWRGGKVNVAAAAGICRWLKLKVFDASERPQLKSETDGTGKGCGFFFYF